MGGYTLHEVGYSLCLTHEDADELVRRYRKSPPPVRPKFRTRKKTQDVPA